MYVKTRKCKAGARICIDASDIFKLDKLQNMDELYRKLSGVFREMYCEGVLVTNDYLCLCDIVIRQCKTISMKQCCDLAMTQDLVIVKLSDRVEEFTEKISKCFEEFYLCGGKKKHEQ